MNIGIFDSGIGGLNITAKLLSNYNHNYFYYADNLNIPYGNKSLNLIKQNVFLAMDYFLEVGCDIVIIACNTVSSLIGNDIKKAYPFKVILIKPNFAYVKNFPSFLLLATDNTTNFVLHNVDNFASEIGLMANQFISKLKIVKTTSLAYLTEQNAPNFYINYSYIRQILNDIHILTPIILGCTHYTYYQRYINSLGYKTISELDYLQNFCQLFNQKLAKTNNLSIKLTSNKNISQFYHIIDNLL